MSSFMEVDSTPSTTSTLKSKSTRLQPWVEKYRPEKVDDVSSQTEVISSLKTGIESGQIPHLLFYGPPGTGKTTTMLALARSLYGPELYKTRILELNASDDRGIQVVREKIKAFASGAVGTQRTAGYPCPRYKFIILDEADTMTPDAQSALRRVMEQYSKVTRFCLICNYVTRLIEPLASRCSKFRFKSLSPSSMINRLTYIAQQEQVNLGEGALDTIMDVCGGDMRKAVNYLQSSHQLSGDVNGLVTKEAVIEMSGQIPNDIMSGVFEAISKRDLDDALTQGQNMIYEGYPLSSILDQFHDIIVTSGGSDSDSSGSIASSLNLKEIDIALISEKIAAVEQCLIDGSSEMLQLNDLICYIFRRFPNDEVLDIDIKSMNH